MKDHKHAAMLVSMARKDLKALSAMRDRDNFDDEIFGFHAQQALEKSLKAWLALIGVIYIKHMISVSFLIIWKNKVSI